MKDGEAIRDFNVENRRTMRDGETLNK